MTDVVIVEKLPASPRKGSMLRSLKAVLWSFVGLRQGQAQQDDLAKLTPFHLVGVGLAVCFVFVIGLMFFVKWVVAT